MTLGWKFNLIITSMQMIVEGRTTDKIAKGQKPLSHCYCKGDSTWLKEISLGEEIQSSQKRRKKQTKMMLLKTRGRCFKSEWSTATKH